MYFPGVLVAKLATSIGPDLHTVSSAKPAILLWCTTSTWTSPQILVNRIPESSGKVFLLPLQTCCSLPRRCPVCFKTYQRPHSTTCGEEKAFSLCRNLRHLPILKSLCVTWLRQHRTLTACSAFARKQSRKSGNIWVLAGVHQDGKRKRHIPQRVVPCFRGSGEKSVGSLQCQTSSCRHEQNVKLLLCSSFDEGEEALKSRATKSPVLTERWRLPSKIAPLRNGLLAPFQLGRLRRPSTWRDAGSRGYSSRASGASQKSAGCEGCVHQFCRPQIRSPEGTNASFASVNGG